MKYEVSKNLSAPEFKRLFELPREKFAQMTELVKQAENVLIKSNKFRLAGKKSMKGNHLEKK